MDIFDFVWASAVETVLAAGFEDTETRTTISSSGFYPAFTLQYQRQKIYCSIQLSAIVVDDDAMIIYCTSESFSRCLNISFHKYKIQRSSENGNYSHSSKLTKAINNVLVSPFIKPHSEWPVLVAMNEYILSEITSYVSVILTV